MKISKKTLKIILLLFLSLLFAVFISFVFAFWTGYPRGLDAPAHALKIFWVTRFFPHHNWWNVWASGMPIFLYYPIGPNLLLALFAKILNYSPEMILTVTAIFSIGLFGFFVGMLVYERSRKFIASILASFVLISIPVIWIVSLSGAYVRVFALPVFVASLYFAGKLAHKPNEKVYQFATIISLALGLSIHTLIGVEAAVLVGALLVFLVPGFKQKILILFRTFFPFVLIMSFYFIPLMVHSPRSSFGNITTSLFDLDNVRFISLKNILGIFPDSSSRTLIFFNLTPFVFPLLVFLLLVASLVKRKTLKQKIIWFYILGAFGFMVIATVRIQLLKQFYHVVGTQGFLHLAVTFAVVAVGILIGKIFGKLANFVSLCLISLLLVFLWFAFSPNPQTWQNTIVPQKIGFLEDPVFNSLEPPPNSQFRLGTSLDSYFAMVFNRYRPDYPQTRDYFQNGILNDDFNYYLVKAVWDWGDNLDETKFLLDWWAVDKLLLSKENEYLEKFANFNLVGEMAGRLMYGYDQATPILSSTNTPTVLFIGERENYMVFFHALAQANINSQKIIPVYLGKDSLQGLKLSELKKFSAVFVYNLKMSDRIGLKNLKSYVEEGGALFIEGRRQETLNLPELFPMKRVKKDEVEKKWDLAQESHDIEIDLEDFSPPVYEEGPWGISTAENLRGWAQVLISESGKPIVIGGNLGKGRIIWSGMNLPYHTVINKNKEESLFLEAIFDWLRDEEGIIETDFEVEFVHPEKRIVKLKNSAKGVLFKEANFPKWRAYIEKDGKRDKLDIYTAGPDFMYIPLSGADSEDSLILEYKKTPVDYIAYIVSLASFVTLILWVFDWWIFKRQVLAIKNKIKMPIEHLSKWWNRE